MTDKCTFFFGGSHNPVCEQHDLDYSAGSGVSRVDADRKLLIGVVETGHHWRGIIMFIGVRTLGWIYYKG